MKKSIITIFFVISISSIAIAKDVQETYLAGGCFWCMEEAFEEVDGVIDVVSGYAGGKTLNPKYEEVSRGKTKHVEAVRIVYDADIVSFNTLLHVFWKAIDPTDDGGQFADRGAHYRTAIFYRNDEEQKIAGTSKTNLMNSGWFDEDIVTELRPFTTFYEAEEYHQDYYKRNAVRYKLYKKGSGRTYFIEKQWEKSKLKNTDPIPHKS